MLIDDDWCQLFRLYNWLLACPWMGLKKSMISTGSTRRAHGTWKRVMQSIETLKKNKVEFNILCVLSQANVEKPREIYKFYRSLGIDNIQYIPLLSFRRMAHASRLRFTAEQYGRFLCETFDLWWPGAPQGSHSLL
jgi:uncharacterized protein